MGGRNEVSLGLHYLDRAEQLIVGGKVELVSLFMFAVQVIESNRVRKGHNVGLNAY